MALSVAVLASCVGSSKDAPGTGLDASSRRVDVAPLDTDRPYLGWSSWSLEALDRSGYGSSFLDEAAVERQSTALHDRLGAYGYRAVDLDAEWTNAYDDLGRPAPDPKRFPSGMAALASFVHGKGQTFGLYAKAGLPAAVRAANPPIKGTTCHADDILLRPEVPTNGWGDGWAIDWTKPCAQAYVDAIAAQWASWGVDLVKLDGVIPGSPGTGAAGLPAAGSPADNRGDVAAWAEAIRRSGRPMWLSLSWQLDPSYASFFAQHANAVRTTLDVECYCTTLTTWPFLAQRLTETARWVEDRANPMLWHDMDSLDVGVGSMDGLTLDERRFAVTLWAAAGSPLYLGDDLTKLDDHGIALLTNREVLAVDQSGRPLRPSVAGTEEQQVWSTTNPDGTVTVALFNATAKAATMHADLAVLGLPGPVVVRDLWTHHDHAGGPASVTATVPAHGAALLRLSPA